MMLTTTETLLFTHRGIEVKYSQEIGCLRFFCFINGVPRAIEIEGDRELAKENARSIFTATIDTVLLNQESKAA